jgi:cell division protein FtsB
MKKTQNNLKNRLKQYSKYLFLFLATLFLISLVRNVFKISEAKKSIDEARARVEKLARENKELSEKLQSVQSENYTEKQLRDKLGMAKEGETVVILPDTETVKKLAPRVEEEEGALPDPVWKHWLRLFY